MHLNNRNTEQWQKIDSAHHLHPFTDFKELINTGTKVIISAEGNYVTDSDNNKILDMIHLGELKAIRIGKNYRIAEYDLHDFIESNRYKSHWTKYLL